MTPKNAIGAGMLLVFAGLLIFGSYSRLFENNELNTLDLRFRLRPAVPTTDQVVIVEIGDDTIGKIGRFPFDRRYHALLVKILSEYGARAVLFDIFFSEPDTSDSELEQAIKNAGNVYLPYVFDMDATGRHRIPQAQGYVAKSLKALEKVSAGTGHINVIPDSDGKYRRAPILVQFNGALYPYLSFHLIADYLGISFKDIKLIPGKSVWLGSRIRIPLDDNSNVIVNYAGDWGKFYQHYSYVDVLRSYVSMRQGEKPSIDLNAFKGKICLVGLTATGTSDLHPNPFASLYPAMAIHGDLINSILNQHFITRATKSQNLMILLILAGLIGWGVFVSKPFKGFLVLTSLIALYALSAIVLFIGFGLWIDLFYPLLALVAVYLACTLIISVREWKKRLLVENELQLARRIQESYLPKSVPSNPGLDVAGTMDMAREVGGDLYDFYEFDQSRLGVVIGDVSGKGIPASLFMTTVCGALRFFALPEASPEETLFNLNVKLTRESSTKLFVTLFYSIFDVENKVMTYSNGGHLPVLYLSGNNPVKLLDVEDGYPIGLLESSYSEGQVNYSKDDIFVFYTDGVTEARNRSEMYGQERLLDVVRKNKGGSAKEILSAIEKDVRKFEPKSRQSDDITLIVVKII